MPDYFDYDAISSDAATYPASVGYLSGSSLLLIMMGLKELLFRYKWRFGDGFTPLDAASWGEIKAYIQQAEKEVISNMLVGTIVYHSRSTTPQGMLACDGTTYNRVDYPTLYSVIHSSLVIDADTFKVPDMRGRVLVGSGVAASLSVFNSGDVGGEEAHTLIGSEIPSHTHSEITATLAIINGGLEAPANAAVPSVGDTGSYGGDGSHNNMQPYGVWQAAIIAF